MELLEYMDDYEIEYTGNPNEKGWVGGVRCPSPDHNDKNPSASYNVNQGKIYCHVCAKMFLIKDYEPVVWRAKEKKRSNGISELPVPDNGFFGSMPKWWFDRHFTEEMATSWGIYPIQGEDIIIPVRNEDGDYRGYVTRHAESSNKYKNSGGLDTDAILFGLDKLLENSAIQRKHIVLVEGMLDTIWLQENGFPAVGVFSNNLSRSQLNIIRELYLEEVWVMFDRDEKGREGENKAVWRLQQAGYKHRTIKIPAPYKDGQDMSKQQLESLLGKAGE